MFIRRTRAEEVVVGDIVVDDDTQTTFKVERIDIQSRFTVLFGSRATAPHWPVHFSYEHAYMVAVQL